MKERIKKLVGPIRAMSDRIGERRQLPLKLRDSELLWPFSSQEKLASDKIQTVCIPIGPYRNLTTLTAAIFALHNNGMVLNHAAIRLLSDKRLDFLKSGSKTHFEKFKRAAVRLSKGGRQGLYGGDIRYAHAFNQPGMRELAEKRIGTDLPTKTESALLWKDSNLLTNHMINNHLSLFYLTYLFPEIRFIFPVRNPIDCAISNLSTGYYQYLTPNQAPTRMDLVYRILTLIRWFDQQSRFMPDSFFLFTEDEFDQDLLSKLCGFVGIEWDTEWSEDVLSTVSLNSPYEHDPKDRDQYKKAVESMFDASNPLRDRLLALEG